jgi:exodeoxyribonuclease VII small subunit
VKKTTDSEPNQTPIDFEKSLEELENLVSKMESGELSLDESLKAFERGIELTRKCQNTLKNAELKIQALTTDNQLESFDVNAADDN